MTYIFKVAVVGSPAGFVPHIEAQQYEVSSDGKTYLFRDSESEIVAEIPRRVVGAIFRCPAQPGASYEAAAKALEAMADNLDTPCSGATQESLDAFSDFNQYVKVHTPDKSKLLRQIATWLRSQ